MGKIFISYARKEDVESLLEKLEAKGLDFWIDRGIPPGNEWQTEIETALDKSSVFLLVLSEASSNSPFQQMELGMALRPTVGQKRKTIIPVLVGGTNRAALPPFLRNRPTIEFDPGHEDRAVEAIAQAAETADAK